MYAGAQQKALPYKDYLDYYSENAKSTVLTKDLNFLADGNYVFKGSKEDFKFLLDKKLEIDKKHLANVDSIYLSGVIKDSVKVNKWTIKYKAKNGNVLNDLFSAKNAFSELDIENFKLTLDYQVNGMIQKLFKNYSGKRTVTYSDEYIYMGFYGAIRDTSGHTLTEKEDVVISRENGTIKSTIVTTSNCGNYGLTVSRTSKNISKSLDTDILFVEGNPNQVTSRAGSSSYRALVKESFANRKLTKISVVYTNQNKGEEYFSKLINNVNYQNIIYQYSLNCNDIH
jgi:hypothetical protein